MNQIHHRQRDPFPSIPQSSPSLTCQLPSVLHQLLTNLKLVFVRPYSTPTSYIIPLGTPPAKVQRSPQRPAPCTDASCYRDASFNKPSTAAFLMLVNQEPGNLPGPTPICDLNALSFKADSHTEKQITQLPLIHS